MHHCETYLYINFQQNWVSRSVKPCTQICLKKNCNLQFEFRKIAPFRHESHNYPYLNRFFRSIGSADFLEPRFKDISTDDGQTDGQISRVTT